MQTPQHPAAAWAMQHQFSVQHLDCITAVMLKILDDKCKMGEAEQGALIAMYDVVKDQRGELFDDSIHQLIATARQPHSSEIAEQVHQQRVDAEARIQKPVMKGFKKMMREQLASIALASETID